MKNKKRWSMVIYILVCIYAIVFANTFRWIDENHYWDIPNYIRYLCDGLILGPLIWAAVSLMDEFKKKSGTKTVKGTRDV